MNASVVVFLLCAQLVCFAVLLKLVSARLDDRRGLDVFAAACAVLATVYVLQLLRRGNQWGVQGFLDHVLAVCVPVIYAVGVLRFVGRPTPVWRPTLVVALVYGVVQYVAQTRFGPVARHATMSFTAAAGFFAIAVIAARGERRRRVHGRGSLRAELRLMSVLIAGLGVLNASKGLIVSLRGLEALSMQSTFQMVFYGYMSMMASLLAPLVIWMVFRQLTDELRVAAQHDALTRLLNRRGLNDALTRLFARTPSAHLLQLDIDHFKRINDRHGHEAGDRALAQLAQVLRSALPPHHPAARAGGEEFIVVCPGGDADAAMALAEKLRAAVAAHRVPLPGVAARLQMSVTIGVSRLLTDPSMLDRAMQEADAALYRGKACGRNRVVAYEEVLASSAAPSNADTARPASPQEPRGAIDGIEGFAPPRHPQDPGDTVTVASDMLPLEPVR